MVKLPPLIGKYLCWLGFHDYRVVSKEFEFGNEGIEKDQCKRCGVIVIRKG